MFALTGGSLAPQLRASELAADLAQQRLAVCLVGVGLHASRWRIDEHDLARFVAAGAPINAAGVGTRMGVLADAPYLDSAYKLVAYDGRPVTKLSTGKATLPGPKQVFRARGLRDTIGLRDEPAPRATVPILEPVMTGGRALVAAEPLAAARARFETDLDGLRASARDLTRPTPPVAEITPRLRRLTEEVQAAARRQARLAPAPS